MPASHFIIPVTRQRTEFSPLDRRVTVVVTPNYLTFCHHEDHALTIPSVDDSIPSGNWSLSLEMQSWTKIRWIGACMRDFWFPFVVSWIPDYTNYHLIVDTHWRFFDQKFLNTLHSIVVVSFACFYLSCVLHFMRKKSVWYNFDAKFNDSIE